MPFFEHEMLLKLVTPSEEKKIKIFLNYISYDVFTDKVSYPIFKERMEIVNQQMKFDLFKVFSEVCGKNKKYIKSINTNKLLH